MYKRFCSLGWNCEPGVALRELGYPESMDYFKWSATKFDSLMRIIEEDFESAYLAQNMVSDGIMVTDTAHSASTHRPSAKYFDEGSNSESDLFAFIEKDKRNRGKLFLDELSSPSPLVFILSYVGTNARDNATKLRSVLLEKGMNPLSLILVVQEETAVEGAWGIEGIDNVYLKSFAPYTDVGSLLLSDWEKIFRNYPVSNAPPN